MPTVRDLITETNVMNTYNEGKYVVFVLNNGIKVKINPNENCSGNRVMETKKGEK